MVEILVEGGTVDSPNKDGRGKIIGVVGERTHPRTHAPVIRVEVRCIEKDFAHHKVGDIVFWDFPRESVHWFTVSKDAAQRYGKGL